MEPIKRYGIELRLVDETDADFIVSLRTNSELNRFISYTSPDISDQILWIQKYKIREKAGLEYYFIAQDLAGNNYGTVRLYNVDEKSFEIGSWLFATDSPLGMAVKAHIIAYETGFELFNAEYCRFEIRKNNKKVLKYIQDFNPSKVNEDELNYYFMLTKENFTTRRNKLSFLV